MHSTPSLTVVQSMVSKLKIKKDERERHWIPAPEVGREEIGWETGDIAGGKC